MKGALSQSQAADYAAALRDLSAANLEQHILLLEVYGGWSDCTPHKIDIAYSELDKRAPTG